MPLLRIVSVNDVYLLENLPRLKSLVDHYAQAGDTLVVALAGDFLAPSLLSSIDAGRGMVDCLNAAGITHVILGNHEDDIPGEELRLRLRELRAVCIGTNILSGLDLPRHARIDVGDRTVGLVGVVMADGAVYHGDPFGGVKLGPANEAAFEETKVLLRSGCQAVVPITHQSIADDRALAQGSVDFPAIIGGHEHTAMLVEVGTTWIVKAGMDATHAVITEIDLATNTTTARLEDVASYPEDASLRALVDRHMVAVRELVTATLLDLTTPLSSKGARSQQTTFGTLLCSRLRDALEADACLFNGGGIRGSREYQQRLTYGDIESEVPFDNELVVAKLPGRVIRDAIVASRAKAPAESGAFLQVDDGIVVDGNDVVVIASAPLDLDRVYNVATVRLLLLGLDRIQPLMDWAEAHPELVPEAGSGREPKLVLVQAFARAIWKTLGGFDVVDANRDDRVTPSELSNAIARKQGAKPSPVLADIILRAIDANADHVISRDEG